MKRLSLKVEVTVLVLFLMLLAALLWASSSRSAEAPAWRTPRPWSPPRVHVVAPRASMTFGRDTDAGPLGASAEAMRLSQSEAIDALRANRPPAVYHLDGSVSMDVRSWMREYSYARVVPAGRVGFGCLDDRASAVRAMRAPAAAPVKEEER